MIRQTLSNDCSEVYQLIIDMENELLPYDIFKQIFDKQINDPHYVSFVATGDHNDVLGFVNIRFEMQLHHAQYIAEVMELVVAPAARGKLIGKALLDHAKQTAFTLGCPQIELSCNQRRIDSHRFYEREGFEKHHFKYSYKFNLK